VKQFLIKHRHSRESGNPGLQVFERSPWAPAFAGATISYCNCWTHSRSDT